MKHETNRRQALQKLAVAPTIVAATTGATSIGATPVGAVSNGVRGGRPNKSQLLPQAIDSGDGYRLFPIQVVAADNLQPVEGVRVEFNWIGSDGGFFDYKTDHEGLFVYRQKIRLSREEVYFLQLQPPSNSRLALTHSKLTIQANGLYFPNVLLVEFHETDKDEMRWHATKRS